MRVRKRWGLLGFVGIVILLLCWLAPCVWNGLTGATRQAEPNQVAEIPCGPTVPCAAGDVHQVEDRACEVARAVLPAVVAVRNPVQKPPKSGWYEDYASGVIVTEDGIVLSQWHVSHQRWDDRQSDKVMWDNAPTYLAGKKTSVILHDGRECPAELLGADRNYDLSLLRLLEPGPYPFLPLRPETEVQVGDWVLKIGHPLGYRRGRSAPVRLGRVVNRIDEIFSTDCGIAGGDSGGPFFNLGGELVGIVEGSCGLTGMAVTADEPLLTLRTESNSLTAASGCRVIHDVFEQMLAGEIVPFVIEDYPARSDRLAASRQLRAEDWTQGNATLDLYRSFVSSARSSVVVVLNHGVAVALGTVVGPDLVITKASELPVAPACRLADGRTVSARVVGVEPAYDLALLKVQATDLKSIEWSEELDPPVGTMLAAVGPEALPLAVGVLSVPRYEMSNPRAPTYALPLHITAHRPDVFGTTEENGDFCVQRAAGLSWAAGIRPGDVLREVAGHKIHSNEDLVEAVKGYRSGEVVSVAIERNGKTMARRLPLAPKPQHILGHGNSYRSNDFPILFECAVPFLSFECGGPIVGRDGRAVGVSIARVASHGGMAVPGDCVQRLLPDLQAGRLAKNWTPREHSTD